MSGELAVPLWLVGLLVLIVGIGCVGLSVLTANHVLFVAGVNFLILGFIGLIGGLL